MCFVRITPACYRRRPRRDGGTGRRGGLKNRSPSGGGGSTPPLGTNRRFLKGGSRPDLNLETAGESRDSALLGSRRRGSSRIPHGRPRGPTNVLASDRKPLRGSGWVRQRAYIASNCGTDAEGTRYPPTSRSLEASTAPAGHSGRPAPDRTRRALSRRSAQGRRPPEHRLPRWPCFGWTNCWPDRRSGRRPTADCSNTCGENGTTSSPSCTGQGLRPPTGRPSKACDRQSSTARSGAEPDLARGRHSGAADECTAQLPATGCRSDHRTHRVAAS